MVKSLEALFEPRLNQAKQPESNDLLDQPIEGVTLETVVKWLFNLTRYNQAMTYSSDSIRDYYGNIYRIIQEAADAIRTKRRARIVQNKGKARDRIELGNISYREVELLFRQLSAISSSSKLAKQLSQYEAVILKRLGSLC